MIMEELTINIKVKAAVKPIIRTALRMVEKVSVEIKTDRMTREAPVKIVTRRIEGNVLIKIIREQKINPEGSKETPVKAENKSFLS